MKKQVVLFNLDMNTYLSKAPCLISNNYNSAMIFDSEEFALAFLYENKETLKNSSLIDWCTRTFYSIN